MKEKAANEVLDWVEDYSADMAATDPADTIASSEWSVTGGLVVDSESNTPTTTTVWLSGGNNYSYATAVNKITTAGGRTFERTSVFDIKPITCD